MAFQAEAFLGSDSDGCRVCGADHLRNLDPAFMSFVTIMLRSLAGAARQVTRHEMFCRANLMKSVPEPGRLFILLTSVFFF